MSDLTTVEKLRNAASGTILIMEKREADAMSVLLRDTADYVEALEESVSEGQTPCDHEATPIYNAPQDAVFCPKCDKRLL